MKLKKIYTTFTVWGFALAVFGLHAEMVSAQTATWTTCAREDGICSFSGTKEVRYGAGTKWVTKTFTSSTPCTNAVFGDPIPGTGKSCEYSSTVIPPIVTWTTCAIEGATCSFTGTREVRYGAGTNWVTKTFTNSTQCTNAVFGDPIPNTGKSCQYSSTVIASPTPTVTWTTCAQEDRTCTFSGTREVRYGAGTKWSIKTFTNSTPCTNAVFGDPIPGSLKSCQYSSVVITAPAPTPTPTPEPTPSPTVGSKVTDVVLESTSSIEQKNIPFTFGQAFVKGNLLPTEGLAAQAIDGSTFSLQVDVKALHTDGSVRHAIISGILPSLSAGTKPKLNLMKTASPYKASSALTPTAIASAVSAVVNVTIEGVAYKVNLSDLLAGTKYSTWLSGPVASEFILSSPLKNVSTGLLHPNMTARFAVRYYPQINKAKIDVVMENGWIYESNVRDYTYDIQIQVGGQSVYSKTALTHYTRARWHKNFWTNTEPQINVRQNIPYLISTKAVPNYEQLTISETTLANLKADFDKSNRAPMATSLVANYMPMTGGRSDIGLNPAWHVLTLLSMDKRAKEATMGIGDAGGSFSVHLRDKLTDQPASLADYPNMTMVANSSSDYNSAAQRSEFIPGCSAGATCANPNTPDTAHQPALNYIPYLLSGEHFQMEELMFYGMWSIGSSHPSYREFGKGLVKYDQLRGMAWTLRTMAYNAYILPDSNRLKSHFKKIVEENLNWFNNNYTRNSSANLLGFIDAGYTLGYNSGRGLAGWQDDFFTSAIGMINEMEFNGALELLKWKAKFSVGRMTAPGVCWILGAAYSLNVRDSEQSPYYTTFAQMYKGTHSAALQATPCASEAMAQQITAEGERLPAGAMTGYPDSTVGMPSDMRPALAFAKDSGIAYGAEAWNLLNSSTIRPDYSTSPQFDIVPRTK